MIMQRWEISTGMAKARSWCHQTCITSARTKPTAPRSRLTLCTAVRSGGGRRVGELGYRATWLGTCRVGDERRERYRANFAHGPAAIADVNLDGSDEVIAVGNVYDCISGYPSRYNGVYIFNADRSRFTSGGYDWEHRR